MEVDANASYLLFGTTASRRSEIRLTEGTNEYISAEPLEVIPGSATIIHITRDNSGAIRTVIGQWVENVHHMNDKPDGVNLAKIDDLQFRNVEVGQITIPPGSYTFTVIPIIDLRQLFLYCEFNEEGTNSQICGRVEDTRQAIEDYRFNNQVQDFLFSFSISLFLHVFFILFFLIMIAYWTGSL